ncbi:hypothetical protein ACRE_063000 [Hapsidospora chrysogenum ATCC 11550]|uniref:Uncharacterized protein n=1 Tax=Hapsidospora chrysogenum (strain ATCC 11550 / CBS 779.69 / DSM 880 / IAM 14645 / JCM 23072 / IMI 49137) TaxID=857340 RepID=A0A086T0S1_HAPC1|nr:hypothetical protein ACRE_063000 [Hapsidospora chrysogenum ATCC 11550]
MIRLFRLLHRRWLALELAITEPSIFNSDQGGLNHDHSDDDIASDHVTADLPLANNEPPKDALQGAGDPPAPPAAATGRRTSRVHNLRIRPPLLKRASVGPESDESDDEHVLGRKRRKVAAPVRRRHAVKNNPGPRRTRARVSEPQADEQEAEGAIMATASYKEWALSNARPIEVWENGRVTFNIQFDPPPSTYAHSHRDRAAARA